MVGYLGKRTNQQRDITGQQAQSEREAMWGPIPGEIIYYDPASQTATVQPLYKPVHNGQPVAMPLLFEVPLDLPRTGSAGITFPIPAGTKVMLSPMMRSMDNYDADGDGAPFDGRSSVATVSRRLWRMSILRTPTSASVRTASSV
jgi:hypothetical protein